MQSVMVLWLSSDLKRQSIDQRYKAHKKKQKKGTEKWEKNMNEWTKKEVKKTRLNSMSIN